MATDKQLRPGWTEYFLDIAKAVGRRATCLRRRYGAIIVKDKIIISTGYNGAPRAEDNCIDTGICERERQRDRTMSSVWPFMRNRMPSSMPIR